MSRIACLHIPRFQIVVHQKHEQLTHQPFALISGKLTPGGYSRARIFMCSKEASKHNISPQMRLSEAKAVCSQLVLRELDRELYLNAQSQLTDILTSCSPKVTAQELGDFLLDASGLLHLGGESKFCHNVLKVCSRAGFTDAYIGIADSAFAATVATRLTAKHLYMVPAGKDAEFLAPLSIKHLRLDPDIESSLLNLGIKSMGQLVNLPVQSLVQRFGTEGRLAHELAQGRDSRNPTVPEPELKFECWADMGGAISLLNETTFALKAMLDQLTADLKQHGLWAEELVVSLYNEDDKFNERTLKLIRPSNHAKFLLQVIKLSLEADPLEREFTRIKISISRFSKELWEQPPIDENTIKPLMHRDESRLSLNQRSANNGSGGTAKLPSSLLLLLQRFMTSMGSSMTATAVASDHYTLDQAGTWMPVTAKSFSDSIIPINLDYITRDSEAGFMPSDMVLRRNSAQVLVELKDDVPAAVNYQRQWYRIKSITRPEHLSVFWWDKLSSKDYYRILVEPATTRPTLEKQSDSQQVYLMLLTHDRQSGAWRVEGFFD